MKLINLILGYFAVSPSTAISNHEHVEPLNIVISSDLGGRSHVKYLLEISKVLRDRGHHITYAASKDHLKFNKPYNYTFHDIGGSDFNIKAAMQNYGLDRILESFKDFIGNGFGDHIVKSFEESFENFENLLKTQKVDLVMCDFFSPVCSDAAHKHSAPLIIGFQGFGFGVGAAPFITDNLDESPTTTDKLNFFERVKVNAIDPLYNMYSSLPLSRKVNVVRQKFGIPFNPIPFGDFSNSMKISNTYFGFEDPRPLESTLKLIGPVISDEIPPLNDQLQQFLDSHKTLYAAFGSHVTLPLKLIKSILGAIQLALNNKTIDGVIWALVNNRSEDFPSTYEVNGVTYSTDQILKGTHPTIKILNWAPQVSILNHPNTKLFLSHGGVESAYESIHYGTPILCMPIWADQPRNAQLFKNRGVGDFVHTKTANSNEIYEKIKELTRDDNHELQTRMKHVQSISHYKNSLRLETVKFIEHYAQSAKICRQVNEPKPFEIPCELEPYMQADSRMSFLAAYKIDILLTVVGIVSIIIISTILISYTLVKKFIYLMSDKKIKEE